MSAAYAHVLRLDLEQVLQVVTRAAVLLVLFFKLFIKESLVFVKEYQHVMIFELLFTFCSHLNGEIFFYGAEEASNLTHLIQP